MDQRDFLDLGRPRLSVVVPCYNEEDSLKALEQRLPRACAASVGSSYEIILVDDGSSDRTWDVIAALSLRDARIVGVSLSRNFGHQMALTAGLGYARGDRIFVIDSDLQDPPELLSDMMRLMDEGADVVYGQRLDREGETRFKRWSAALFYRLLARMTDVKVPLDTGDFRLMSRRVLRALQSMPEQHRFVRGLVAWTGFRQVALPYTRQKRVAGTTKYPLGKMIRFAIDALTGFSVLPLRITSIFGACFGLLGLGMLLYVAISWCIFNAVAGWASTVALISTLGGIQLMGLGILGEYLGRVYMEVKNRPHFIVRETVRALPFAPVSGEDEYPQIQARSRSLVPLNS
ncbi:MAG TPA: glycosyltransferase family 2 protein [Stellaceae bacterium]|nr:glycosyltransferase family 2 protein [Stellaceae bacterium]